MKEALTKVLEALEGLGVTEQVRVLLSAAAYLDITEAVKEN